MKIDLDSKQVAREVRESLHIRIYKSTLNHNTGKMYIPKSLTSFLEQADQPMSLTKC